MKKNILRADIDESNKQNSHYRELIIGLRSLIHVTVIEKAIDDMKQKKKRRKYFVASSACVNNREGSYRVWMIGLRSPTWQLLRRKIDDPQRENSERYLMT